MHVSINGAEQALLDWIVTNRINFVVGWSPVSVRSWLSIVTGNSYYSCHTLNKVADSVLVGVLTWRGVVIWGGIESVVYYCIQQINVGLMRKAVEYDWVRWTFTIIWRTKYVSRSITLFAAFYLHVHVLWILFSTEFCSRKYSTTSEHRINYTKHALVKSRQYYLFNNILIYLITNAIEWNWYKLKQN